VKNLLGIGWAAGLTLGMVTFAAACNMDGVKGGKDGGEGDAQATHVSNFAGKGELCGTYVTFNGFVGDSKGDLGRASSLMVQLGVCGGQGTDGESKALAITHASPQVEVQKGAANGVSDVFVDDKTMVVRRPDGKKFKIGTLDVVERGHKVDLEDGVKVQVMVDGEPYSLETSKATGSKAILVTIPD
jgi:hypothetical protein